MAYRNWFFALLVGIGIFYLPGCLNISGGGSSKLQDSLLRGSLGFNLKFRHSPVNALIKGQVDPGSFGVKTIRVNVTATSFSLTKSFDFIAGGKGTLENIPIGKVFLLVEALNETGLVAFSGSQDLTVLPGEITLVESLTLFSNSNDSNAPLLIAGINVGASFSTSARIDFLTSKNSLAEVSFGTFETELTNLVKENGTPATNHQIFLTGLNPSTTYFFRVKAGELNGNSVESSLLSFTTSGAGQTSGFSLALNGGATHTNSTQVNLTLSATSLATQVKIAEGSTAPTLSTAKPFSSLIPFSFSSGDGLKTVTVLFLNAAGDTLSQLTGTITLDTVKPTLTTPVVSNISSTDATISATASEEVFWNFRLGLTIAFEKYNATDTVPLTSNSFNSSKFGALLPNTLYFYSVTVTDRAGNSATSGSGADFSTLSGTAVLNNSFVSKFGQYIGANLQEGTLADPRGIVSHTDGSIFVLDNLNPAPIQKFDSLGNLIAGYAVLGIGSPKNRLGIDSASSKLLAITTVSGEKVLHQILMSNFTIVGTYTLEGVNEVEDVKIASDGHYLVVNSNSTARNLYKIDKTNLGSLATFTLPATIDTNALSSFDYDSNSILVSNSVTSSGFATHYAGTFTPFSLHGVATSSAGPTSTNGEFALGVNALPVVWKKGTPFAYSPDFNQNLTTRMISKFDQTASSGLGSFNTSIGNFGTSLAPGPVVLKNPGDLVFDNSGNIHIADPGNKRVAITTEAGTLVKYYGHASPSFHFYNPSGIEYAAPQNEIFLCRIGDGPRNANDNDYQGLVSVYNADTHAFSHHLELNGISVNHNSPIHTQHIPATSSFYLLNKTSTSYEVQHFGVSGNAASRIQVTPNMVDEITDLVYIPSVDQVWVAASASAHLHAFQGGNLTLNSGFFGQVNSIAAGNLTSTAGLTTDNTQVFASDPLAKKIILINLTGTVTNSFTLTLSPYELSYSNGRLYVVAIGPAVENILVLNSSTGAILATVGSLGSSDGQLVGARSISTSSSQFWVSENGNCRVQKFLQ